MELTFTPTTEYIPLNKLLKLLDIGAHGGAIKSMIKEGSIYVNGVQEFRIRNKLVVGDIVTYPEGNITITIQ